MGYTYTNEDKETAEELFENIINRLRNIYDLFINCNKTKDSE